MTFKKLNNITGWLAGLIATIVYLLTTEPTSSWWDCGEYISTAYKLQVGHPPGAPLFQMLGRFFSLFAAGDVSKVALMINIMSVICSGLTIVFLFWTITMLTRKLWMKEDEDAPLVNKVGVLLSGLIGALAYTFTESFWFSAVEGEVYAMSSFFTAVTFWAILKWERVADTTYSFRWLIFIAFLIGLSIGVHLLNLLCIPAIVYVVYFKKYKKKSTWGFILAGILSIIVLGFIEMLLIPQILNIAGKMELFFVNSLGAPFHLGTIVYFLILTALIVWGLIATTRRKKVVLNTCILAFMFILIGYSSFFMLTIRANTNTPINENEPTDALSLLSYINRDQYGGWPLLYGSYYTAEPIGTKKGSPTYVKDKEKGRYVMTDDGTSPTSLEYVYPKEMQTIFPRMWSTQRSTHGKAYDSYRKDKRGSITGTPTKVRSYSGSTETVLKPTFGQNLMFFFSYQLNHMYWRYFMWNFVGRQNDIESQGEIDHGNWISGIGFIDNARLGNQSNLPPCMKNPGRTQFYFLPLILGLIGLVWLLKRDFRQSWIIFLLFFMTGIAIIIYLNQTPYQPRERDYSYAGSFYAFAIWIGYGVIAIIDWMNRLTKSKKMATTLAVGAVCLMAVPVLMGAQGWEEHNRAGKTSARDWARNYLTQLPPNSVIFTRGDNDTFPLWYVQEVEGFRTDVRVVNYMLASGYWYIHQMGRKVYESERLPMTLPPSYYDNGRHEAIAVYEEPQFKGKYIELKDVIDFIGNPKAVRYMPNGTTTQYIPCRSMKLTVDKEACIRNGIVPESLKDSIVDEIRWDLKVGNQNYIFKNSIMLLDFMASNNWERPVYFTSFSDMSSILGIEKYLHMEGLAYRFIPVEVEEGDYRKGLGGVYREGSYDLLVNKAQWGNLNQPGVVPDRESVRNSEFARQSYSLLAQSLANHHQYDSAIVVMDKFQEFFPNEKFPFEVRSFIFPELYYLCGDNEKGDRFMRTFVTNCTDKLNYYSNLKPRFRDYYSSDIDQQLSLLHHMSGVAKQYRRETMKTELDGVLQEALSKFYVN